jgi:transcriptional regulator with XRE-family HTH domain
MIIGDRLRELREHKRLSQGDVEERTGMMRCYISRVENGHTVPAVETLEKFARALEVPMYELLYEGKNPPGPPNARKAKAGEDKLWGSEGKDARLLAKFCQHFSKISERDRGILLATAQSMEKKAR